MPKRSIVGILKKLMYQTQLDLIAIYFQHYYSIIIIYLYIDGKTYE